MAYIFSLLILATQAFVTILPNPVAVPAPFPGGKHFQDDIFVFSNYIQWTWSFRSSQTEFCVLFHFSFHL